MTRKKSNSSKGQSVHIALLRGINVAGRNKLPMSELASMFEDAGCNNVQTYIQSGNVVFVADKKVASQISATILKSIVRKFGFEVPIVTRSADEIKWVVNKNPFLPASDEGILHL